jgi:hypothetical protein
VQRDQGVQGRLFGASEEEGRVPGTGAFPAAGNAGDAPGELTQPEGEITFDSLTYSYRGYVLEGGAYVRRTFTFTPDEVYIYPSEPLWRVRAMVDSVGRDAGRQAEIKRYGKRAWHSPYRPQDAAMQGLDWVFRHDVERVSACYPYATGFYAADAAEADRWTVAMYDAYKAFALHKERAALLRLLQEVGIPPQVVVGSLP